MASDSWSWELDGSEESGDEKDDIDGDSYDDDTGEVNAPKPHDSLEAIFRENKPPEIGEEEEAMITSLLRLILDYDPLKRPCVTDILQHPCFIA